MKRIPRILALALLLFVVVSVAQTTEYLGLPFEPRPIFMDCFPQAKWNGKVYVPTGRTICLSDSQVP
jgi:hypothetical protein